MIYAAYSGDAKVFERGISLQSVLANVPLPVPATLLTLVTAE